MNATPVKRKTLRISAKKVLVTYSKVPEALTPEEVVSQLEKKIEFSKHVIGTERHADGEKHFHLVLIADRKLEFRSARPFDIDFEGKRYKCNCQSVKNLSAAVKYVCKDKDYKTNIKNLHNGALLTAFDFVRDMADREGIQKALTQYDEEYPHLASGGKSLLSIQKYLKCRYDLQKSSVDKTKAALATPFTLEDFKPMPEIERWRANGHQPTWILVGPAG